MRGRHPKDPKLRQRRNAPPATTAELSDATVVRKAPELPRMPKRRPQWHSQTKAMWARVWASPMAERYLTADIDGLFVLATLHDAYWRALDRGEAPARLAAELRRQGERYGLDVFARRRLDWRIREPEQPEQPERKAAAGGDRQVRERPDPRAALRLVESGKDKE